MITKPIKPIFITITGFTLLFFIAQYYQHNLMFDRDKINSSEYWRILSGNLTHINITHLLLNLSGLWIFGFLFYDFVKSTQLIFYSFFLSLFVGFGLYHFNPELYWYYGFSGILYGLYFIGATQSILHNDKFTGFSVITLLTVKLIWDNINTSNPTNNPSAELIGIPIATDAHLYGVTGAILISGYYVIKYNLKQTHPP